MKDLYKKLRVYFLGMLAYLLFFSMRATWRLKEAPLPKEIQDRLNQGLPVVFAHFHEDEWAMLGFYAYRNMNVLVSISQDGSIMAEFLKRLGYKVARGSSSRRAVGGLLSLIKNMREQKHGNMVSVAIDGPKGPRRKPKGGIFKLAEALNAPVVGAAAFAKPAWIFKKSWARTFVPKFFSTLYLVYGEVLTAPYVQEQVKAGNSDRLSEQLETIMLNAKSLAAKSRSSL